MNARQPIAAALSILTLSNAAVARETPETPTQKQAVPALGLPNITVVKDVEDGWVDDKDMAYHISFPVPMVAESKVGSEVEPGYFTTSFPEHIKGVWESASSIRLNIDKPLPPLQILRIEVPAGVKSRDGIALSGNVAVFPTDSEEFYKVTSCEDNSGDIIIAEKKNEMYKGVLPKLLPGIYYKEGNTKQPLCYRPLTVAEAQKNSYALYSVRDYELVAKLYSLPDEQVLEGYWVVSHPGHTPGCDEIKFMLPQAAWDGNLKCYTDAVFHTSYPPKQKYELTATSPELGRYTIKLVPNVPAAAATAEDFVQELFWTFTSDQEPEIHHPLEWKDGALRGQLNGSDIVINVTGADKKNYRQKDGTKAAGIHTLHLETELGETEIDLHCAGDYKSLLASRLDDELKAYTYLCPARPYIYTDITASHIRLIGSTTLRCEYGHLKQGQARVHRLDNNPENAVRLLQEYDLRYKNERYGYDTERRSKARQQAGLKDDVAEHTRLDSSKLTGVLAVAERPLTAIGTHQMSLPLAELFPEQPLAGLYFVEIEGTPLRKSKTPVINQGLLQVTDLGLLWKTNGSHIFAHAYSLSTAQDIPAATLSMFSKEGKKLGELPVQNGIAEGKLPPETRYLQLATEGDSVLMPYDPQADDYNTNDWSSTRLMDMGICPAELPKPHVYLFSDRNLYRPGETAHVKGIARWLCDNELSTPQIERVTAIVKRNYREVARIPATVQQDGTFAVDIPLQEVGGHSVTFRVEFQGDADKSSPDMAFLAAHPEAKNYVYIDRTFDHYLNCKEFRRNEFEVTSELDVQADNRKATLRTTATNLTSTPVAAGKVSWSLNVAVGNFYPKQQQWREFCFGDFRKEPWQHFYAYMDWYNEEYLFSTADHFVENGSLNDEGKGETTFSWQDKEYPGFMRLTARSTVTNDKEQSINSVQKTYQHPSEVYAGIRAHEHLAKVGENMPIDVVAVKPDGAAWDGAPLPATLTVTRSIYHPYHYGAEDADSVENSEEQEIVCTMPVELTGTPTALQIPLKEAGQYDVQLSGKDAKGNLFRSVTRHYVWGSDESPWEILNHYDLKLVPDKPLYKAGDTARILVQTPVDAELLVTLERGRVLRHYRRKVTVQNPMLEVPIEAGDAPIVYLSVSLVQSDDKRRSDGKPQIKLGKCKLKVEATDKILTVKTEASQPTYEPGAPCTVSGTITDAAGNPVANADVALYAEDEGTLQVLGYDLPNPADWFYHRIGREHCVQNYSGQASLVGENLQQRCYGNKGVFIGGGDDEYEGEGGPDDDAVAYMRQNFNPCALWLANVTTDEKGQFTATYTNPDTLTRYRLMAVASAGDKFGSGQSSYMVNKAIMLEPTAPVCATAGDELVLPVTVSMLPENLPAGSGDTHTWSVTLSGENADIPAPTQSVTLTGNKPVTIHFPVTMQKPVPTQLQWRVQAAEGSAKLTAKDAVQLSFPVIPPSPYRSEVICAELKGGQKGRLSKWLKNAYLPGSEVQLMLSTSPFAGLNQATQFLFTYPYGCTEQLSSTVLPWVLRDDLQQALGIQFPTTHKPQEAIDMVKEKLEKRRLQPGSYAYWDGCSEESEYSAYAVLVQKLMDVDMEKDFVYLSKQVRENKGNVYLNLVALAMSGNLSEDVLNAALQRAGDRSELSPEERWVLAYCAEATEHPNARELLLEAQQPETKVRRAPHVLPPLHILRTLHSIYSAPNAKITRTQLQNCLKQDYNRFSTWNNGWLVLAMHAYLQKVDLKNTRAKVNGSTVSTQSPMRVTTTTDAKTTWKATGNTVYVSGLAKGYQAQQQPEQMEDKGFCVNRTYARVLPDGSTEPTATFRVGDVVQVTVSANVSTYEPLRYLALEDRVPAAFEVIDPALTSQALPDGISPEALRKLYRQPSYTSNLEYHKEKVRAFMNHVWNPKELTFSYVVHVVRSGKVTAPAAKAELMYAPHVYGLSIPQRFEVQPR